MMSLGWLTWGIVVVRELDPFSSFSWYIGEYRVLTFCARIFFFFFFVGVRVGKRIIRGTDYIFRLEEQQHSFNFPVQVGTNSSDTPLEDAQRFTVKVQQDDVSRMMAAFGYRLGPGICVV